MDTGRASRDSARASRRRVIAAGVAATVVGLAGRDAPARVSAAGWQVTPTKAPVYERGFVVAVGVNDKDFLAKLRKLLDRLVALKVNSVRFSFEVFQDDGAASTVYAGARDGLETPTIKTMEVFYKEAHRRGMRVMVAPMLNERSLDIANGEWRGAIRPRDVGAWFQSYGTLLVDYARLAQEYGVESFSVGSELSSLEPEAGRWVELIGHVRRVFKGRILYSFNWPTLLTRTGLDRPELRALVDAIDDIGISPYYPLDVAADASVDMIVVAWQQWVDEIRAVKQMFDKRILFTEAGARSIQATFVNPNHSYFTEGVTMPASEGDQQKFFEGLFGAVGRVVDGIYVWNATVYTLTSRQSREELIGYSPLNKRAEGTIREFFGRPDESLAQISEQVAPASVIDAGVIVVVQGGRVNLREFPSVQSQVLAEVEQGTELLATGPVEAGWLPVREEISGVEGFIAARYVALSGEPDER